MAVSTGDTVLYRLTQTDVDEMNRLTAFAVSLDRGIYAAAILKFGVGRAALQFPMVVTSLNADGTINGRVHNEGNVSPYWVHNVALGSGPGQYAVKP